LRKHPKLALADSRPPTHHRFSRHAGHPEPGGSSFSPAPRHAARTPTSPRSSEATISRTTLPTKRHIRCYDCAYEFNLTGRMGNTYCPKCRASLDLAGYTIDAECRETLKTLGNIKITPHGIVTSAQLLAQTSTSPAR